MNTIVRPAFNRLALLSPSPIERTALFFLLVNMIFISIRPQNELGIIGAIQLPFLVNAIPAVYWLQRIRQTASPQFKAFCCILILGAIHVPLATNNRMAFEGWRNLLQLAVGFVFPIIVFCANSVGMRRMIGATAAVTIYLGIYSITHGGRGPGDYLGDENDLGLVLTMYLGIMAFVLTGPISGKLKFLVLASVGLAVVGVIGTMSRGAFVGMIGVTGYLLVVSNKRFIMIFLILLGGLLAAAVAPQEYWDDIRSISDTQSGTAKQRREYWAVATRMFLDPRNILIGVGMKNTPFRMGEYEPRENLLSSGRSVAGRQVHSLYFQLFPELGLVGGGLFLWVVFSSFGGNIRTARRLRKLSSGRVGAAHQLQSEHLTPHELSTLRKEGLIIQTFMSGLNAGWVGVLVSGLFISVLYYPPIWFLAGLSAAMQRYAKKVEMAYLHSESAEKSGTAR